MEIWIAIIGSGALSALISGIFQLLQQRTKRNKSVTNGLQCLLWDRINHLGKTYISQGYIDAEDLKRLIEMHKVYHDELNGNGYLDAIMTQVKKLPIRMN